MLICPFSSTLLMLIENDSFLSFIPVSSESYVVSSIHALDVPTYTFHNFHKLCATLKTLHISKIDPDVVAVVFYAFQKFSLLRSTGLLLFMLVWVFHLKFLLKV